MLIAYPSMSTQTAVGISKWLSSVTRVTNVGPCVLLGDVQVGRKSKRFHAT